MVRIERKRNIGNAAAVSSAAATKKKARANATGSASFAHSLAGVASSEQNIGGIDEVHSEASVAAREEIGELSLLAIQEHSSKNEKKSHKKAIELGEGLLKKLEDLHLRILSENMPNDKLEQMEQFFAQKREHIQDEKLRAILAEIDLRVQVELAKRRK